MPNTTANLSKKAVLIGVENLVFAPLTQDDSSGVAYGTEYKHVPGLIEVALTAQVSEDQLGADDNVGYEVLNTNDGYEVSITLAALGADASSFLLGTTMDSNNVEIENAGDNPPWVAMGFKALRSDGTYDYLWLYKGTFSPSDATYHTKEKGNVNWQTPAVKGKFVPRDSDKQVKCRVHSDITGTNASTVLAGFFSTVYETVTG